MNTIGEIGEQNQQDFLSLMYLYVGKEMLETCGREAERAIRRAVHETGKREGESLREQYEKAGIKTNLKTLYQGTPMCTCDPRLRIKVTAQTEQMRLWEVYTCPMASLWLDQDGAYIGNCYCEEQQHGLIMGFTKGKGQLNLTKKLTCHRTNGCRADNYCRFSSYYRAANVNEEERQKSFSGSELKETEKDISKPDVKTYLKKQCIRLYCALYEEAYSQFGQEGICAVSLGLKKLCIETKKLLSYHADATLRVCDLQFLSENLPFSLNPSEDSCWEECKNPEAAKLFELHVIEPLRKCFLRGQD